MTARFEDGHHEFSHGIDVSNNESWARTWLDMAEEYIDIGDWILGPQSVSPGKIYDLLNFLADHYSGHIPWSDDGLRHMSISRSGVLAAIEADPRLVRINAKFRDRYDLWLWKPGWAEEDKRQPDEYSS